MNPTAYQQDRWGYVYCLTNEGFPHLVKIGVTTKGTPQERAKALSKTGTPYPFQVLFAKWVEYPFRTEQELHKTLKQANKHANKEYFHLTPREALRYFEALDGEWDPAPQGTRQPPTARERQTPPPRREESERTRSHAPLIGSIQISIEGAQALRTPLVIPETRPRASLQEVVVEPGAAPAPAPPVVQPPQVAEQGQTQERVRRILALVVLCVLLVIMVWYWQMG